MALALCALYLLCMALDIGTSFRAAFDVMVLVFPSVRTCWPVFTALYDMAQSQSPPQDRSPGE